MPRLGPKLVIELPLPLAGGAGFASGFATGLRATAMRSIETRSIRATRPNSRSGRQSSAMPSSVA